MTRAPTPRPPTRPAVDEWGVYDPQQAGLAALFARLDTKNADRPAKEEHPEPRRPYLRDAE